MKKRPVSRLSIIARYVTLASVIFVVLIGVDIFLGNREKIVYIPPEPLVVVETPQKGSVSKRGIFPSTIQAKDLVPVIPLVGGTIQSFDLQVGQMVQKGEVLATIDSEPFIQQTKQAEAAYLASESTFSRVASLYQNKATTEQSYDQAKAQRDAAKAQYELASLQLSYATVTAPVTGSILMKSSSVGSMAGAQQPIAVIADLTRLVVKVEVPETYYSVFWKGQEDLRIEVTNPAWDTSLSARLLTIDPFIHSDSKTFSLECLVEHGEALVRPGMSVMVGITSSEEEAIPRMAQSIRKSDGSWYVYHPETQRVEYVQTAVELEDDWFFKVPEAYAESLFVVDGQHMVFDNQKVRIVGEGL